MSYIDSTTNGTHGCDTVDKHLTILPYIYVFIKLLIYLKYYTKYSAQQILCCFIIMVNKYYSVIQ